MTSASRAACISSWAPRRATSSRIIPAGEIFDNLCSELNYVGFQIYLAGGG